MALPSGWNNQDVGSPSIAGSADYADSVYTLQGSGSDIWGISDQFQFAYKSLNGDGTITARIASVGNTNDWAKAEVMIRESLDANSMYAAALMTPNNGMYFHVRSTTGGDAVTPSSAYDYDVDPPYWVRLERSGSTFTAYKSADGNSWTQVGSPQTISMATSVYIGLAVTSHNNSALNTSTFDNVSLPIESLTGLPRRALDGPFYGSLRGSVR